MQTMKAVVAQAYGGPEVLHLEEVERPVVQDNEILIRVYNTTVTRADAMMRTGKPYFGRLMLGLTKPKNAIPGTGFSGTVEAVGNAVNTYKVGDAVFGGTDTDFSSNAEFLKVSEDALMLPKPEGLSFEEAATFTDGFVTSYNFLHEVASITSGQHILVNGASGSLGLAALQIAKNAGATITAVCSTRNVGLVNAHGAHHVIDYTKQSVYHSEGRFDIIFDTIGKLDPAKCTDLLTDQGIFISPVLKSNVLIHHLRTIRSTKKRIRFSATGMKDTDALRPMMHALVDQYKRGELQVHIDRQYPLERVADAHRYVDTGRKKGNVVINVNN